MDGNDWIGWLTALLWLAGLLYLLPWRRRRGQERRPWTTRRLTLGGWGLLLYGVGVFFLLWILVSPFLAHAADRSRTLRAEFMRLNPCPSIGATRGSCPGYQVDHRDALVCGGRDELANLQWLAVAEHREKTRVEVKLCRSRLPRPPA